MHNIKIDTQAIKVPNEDAKKVLGNLSQEQNFLNQCNNESNSNEETEDIQDIGFLNYLPLNTENLAEIAQFDSEEFQKGIQLGSQIAGIATALFNAGFSESSVLDIVLNMQTIEHNYQLTDINNKAQIKISENQRVLIDNEKV